VGAFISSRSNNRNGKGERQAATSRWFRAKEGKLGSLRQRNTVHKRAFEEVRAQVILAEKSLPTSGLEKRREMSGLLFKSNTG